jgi:sulfur carrier protein ThiS
MQVKVALFGSYADLLPDGDEKGRATLDVDEGTTVGELLDRLGLPDVGRQYVTVDRRRVDLSAELRDDAELRVIVPLGGG